MKIMTLLLPLCVVACGKPADPAAPSTPNTTQGATDAPNPSQVVAAPPEEVNTVDAVAPIEPEPIEPEPAEVVPAVDEAAVTQCKAILQKSWAAVKPVLERVGVVADAALEATYTTDINYITPCVALTKEQRDCLEAADHPVVAIETCKINEPKRVLWAYNFRDELDLWPPVALPAGEGDKLLAGLVGTWEVSFDAVAQKETWVIGEGGVVTSFEVTKDGVVDAEARVPEKISFTNTDEIEIQWKGSTTPMGRVFFMESPDVFYASGNLLYRAYRVEDTNKFVVRNNWDTIVFNNGKCEVVSGQGLAIDGKCSFTEEEGKKLFRVEFMWPDQTRATTADFTVIGKYLVTDGMVATSRYVRKK